jgi:uridine kinase
MLESLERAARAVAELPARRRVLVAVDGVDGAGKSTSADGLVPHIERPVVRASVDDFHQPRAIRYRRGRESPQGFYLDSFNLEALRVALLAPFAAGEGFRRRVFDHLTDAEVTAEIEDAPDDAVLLVDGLFLHRNELLVWWDFSILLEVEPAVAARRLQRREGKPTRQRYVRGQELYFAEAKPTDRASLVLPW